MSDRKILIKGGIGEIVEKKSRFIANIVPVQTEEEAAGFIAGCRRKYYDARHNCTAYVIGKNNELTRCSDDGEPSGTAGRPMLEVLLGSEIHNIAVVVTRYFGGILLGTGGLVRAYTAAVQEGLKACQVAVEREGRKLTLSFAYSEVDRVQSYLKRKRVDIAQADYGSDVVFEVIMAATDWENGRNELTELTNGNILIMDEGECTFLARE